MRLPLDIHLIKGPASRLITSNSDLQCFIRMHLNAFGNIFSGIECRLISFLNGEASEVLLHTLVLGMRSK